MMIAAGREESCLLPEALHQLEAEHADVKAERTVEIGDFEMDMADARARIDRARRRGDGLELGRHCIRCGHSVLRSRRSCGTGPPG